MRLHSGKKPYSCSNCNKSFALKSILKDHVRLHTGEKPHWCSVCNILFTQNNHLQTHLRLHTGEKPYSCSIVTNHFHKAATFRTTWNITLERYLCEGCQCEKTRALLMISWNQGVQRVGLLEGRSEFDSRLGTTGRLWREASANVLYECDWMNVYML